MRTFIELFARSPFAPLTKHAEKVQEVVGEIRPLMDAMMDEDWQRAGEHYERISRLEHQADDIKQEIRDHLPRSLFLPVDRGDLLKFLKEQDAIADSVEDLAVLVTMRETRGPDVLKVRARELVDGVIKAAETWFSIASQLPDLQESSFTGPEVRRVLELIDTVHQQEWQTDRMQASLGRSTIRFEEELGAVSVMFWMRIAGKLGDVANHAENAADLLRMMLAKGR
ncbi:MAG TPA: TIGR00153 family protein [Longimicrobiales bacterium]|nr:TIGR00153 family protein [Longimicrobiales bacterium]